MCGIFCCIYSPEATELIAQVEQQSFESNISRRGPDYLEKQTHILNEKWHGEFVASVLWMQGTKLIPQPCADNRGNILLWNGDIFYGPLANDVDSDTLTLLTTLKDDKQILETLSAIKGPYSFVYFQKSSNILYFGRDCIGRHSLLVKRNQSNLTIASVASKDIEGIVELPAVGIYALDLNHSSIRLTCHPWEELSTHRLASLNEFKVQLGIDVDIATPVSPSSLVSYPLDPRPGELAILENNPTMSSLLNDPQIRKRVMRLLTLLRKSIKVRVMRQPRYCRDCMRRLLQNKEESMCHHSKTGILFSGGLDSTILAQIADEFVPESESIDLINVAFENKKNSQSFDVPDRITGRQALEELRQNCPKRNWNFIESNVSRKELETYCSSRICHLIYPRNKILDESLGCAVWFASRGSGILPSVNDFYQSPCRVLLLGMGADELFGGYTKYRNTLRRGGWPALTQELSSEIAMISERNLGRDDRVVCDHGRQSRLPYLDEDLVNFVKTLRPWERCYPTESMPPGSGDKLLLRLLAYEIGLKTTASFPKRAFQFGSRIANSKEKGKDVSNWL